MATTPHGSSSAEQVAEALQFVVQHEGSSIDQQTLCRLLQTHSTVWRALQACRSQCAITLRLTEADAASVRYENSSSMATSTPTDIIVVAPLSESEEGAKVPSFADPPADAVAAAGRKRLVSFARWLRRHAGLVGRCTVVMPAVYDKPGVLIKLQLALGKALQDCAPPPPAAPVRGVTTRSRARSSSSPTARPLVGLPLQLQSLSLAMLGEHPSGFVPVVSRLLRAVTAGSMRLQELDAGELWEVGPGFSAALKALQSLRSLRLEGRDFECMAFPADQNVDPFYNKALLSAVGSLGHLTSLHVDATVSMFLPRDAQLLPESLGVLEVMFVQGAGNEDRVDLSRLTALTRLRWASAERYVAVVKSLELVLPPKLNTLIAGSPLPRVQGAQIKLQQLKVQLVKDDDCDVLASLLSLTAPVELSVVLALSWEGDPNGASGKLTVTAVERAAAAVGACSSIVSFELDAYDFALYEDDGDSDDESEILGPFAVERVRWCQTLAKLPALERLVITGQRQRLPLRRDDVMSLTALTRLSELQIVCGWRNGLDDMSAVALALHLTRLQRLHLDSTSIETFALLPVVAQRTGLRSLFLAVDMDVTDRELPLLTNLTRLTSLTVAGHKCSAAAQARLRLCRASAE